MVNGKFFCHLTILLLSFCFMVVECSLEPSDQFLDSLTHTKQDALMLHKRPSFFVGSRYGRSGSSSSGSSVFATSKTRRLNVVPRNDRFFLSSRYGKRAEISTGTQLSSKPIPTQLQQQQQQFNDDFNMNHVVKMPPKSAVPPYAHMTCAYTGLKNYYRCNSIYSAFYYKNSVINEDDDENINENEVLSTDATEADVLLNNNGHNVDSNENDNDNDNDNNEK